MSTRKSLSDILNALTRCLPEVRPLGLHEPSFEGEEWAYVKECIDTGWVSSAGSYVDRFEAMLAERTGVDHAVAVVNGTSALHVALQVAGVESGDEVIVPALTFVATANAVSYCGAVPHFADSERETLGLDPERLDGYLDGVLKEGSDGPVNRHTGRPVRAIVPVHTFGHPVDMVPLLEVARRHDLAVVEDAAEALGSRYRGGPVGGQGDLAILSFNGNKTVTTGGGGAILTDDADLAEKARHLTTTAKVDDRRDYFHDRIGYNYRLPNLNAALGCAQLEKLPDLIERKRRLARRYRASFRGVRGVHVLEEPSFARSNYWLNALILDPDRAGERSALLDAASERGIEARPAWTLLADLPMYRDCPQMDLSMARSLQRRIVNVPSGASLVRDPVGADSAP
jgi:perosamine synthetase